MKTTSKKSARRDEETAFLARVLENPERLRERLVLAIALAPPKAGKSGGRRRRFRVRGESAAP